MLIVTDGNNYWVYATLQWAGRRSETVKPGGARHD